MCRAFSSMIYTFFSDLSAVCGRAVAGLAGSLRMMRQKNPHHGRNIGLKMLQTCQDYKTCARNVISHSYVEKSVMCGCDGSRKLARMREGL